MRLVYSQDASEDRTPGQKALRKLFEDSPMVFLSRLAGLEKAHRESVVKEKGE
jgi:fructose-1,6-bisphosphatase